MANHSEIAGRFLLSGRPVIVNVIENPTIDDVLTAEARIQASLIERGVSQDDRRVPRNIRDYLVRLGVER